MIIWNLGIFMGVGVDMKYVMGFLYGCCTHVFYGYIAKNT